jgi:hypothetical protein
LPSGMRGTTWQNIEVEVVTQGKEGTLGRGSHDRPEWI